MSKQLISLDKLAPKVPGKIHSLVDDERTIGFLTEMGLMTGTPVELIKFAPLGDPIEIKVRGYHLSIRKELAKTVLVETDFTND